MLAIKDGGVNDTDGEQADNTGDANGVVASTISIARRDLEDSIDPPSSGGSSGGGCVYNPNAPARFDMGFILLMVLLKKKPRFHGAFFFVYFIYLLNKSAFPSD
jgi:hypothetical protein